MNKITLAIAALFSFNIIAAEVQFGRIVDLKGEGFISSNGKTREMRKGDAIEMGAEIVIEHHGQVTFTDNADHRFHLGNASSAAVSGKGIELRSGDLWFQSLNKNDTYSIKTANATIEYTGGEAILTYDSSKGKSQLMVINGMMKLSNLRQPELNLTVGEGLFSFVDNTYEEGAPRDPTPVGEKTYGQLVSLFSGIAPMDKHSEEIFKGREKHETVAKHEKETSHVASRAVASVHEDKKTEVEPNLIEEYKNSLLEKKPIKNSQTKAMTKTVTENKIVAVKKKTVGAKMIVHVYGQSSKPTVAFTMDAAPAKMGEKVDVSRSRAPASVLDQDVPNDSALERAERKSPAGISPASPYSKEYKQQYKESDKLIDDLKKL